MQADVAHRGVRRRLSAGSKARTCEGDAQMEGRQISGEMHNGEVRGTDTEVTCVQMERRVASPLTVSASVSGGKGKTLPIIRSRIFTLRTGSACRTRRTCHQDEAAALSHSSATHRSPVGRRRDAQDGSGWRIRRADSRYQLVKMHRSISFRTAAKSSASERSGQRSQRAPGRGSCT